LFNNLENRKSTIVKPPEKVIIEDEKYEGYSGQPMEMRNEANLEVNMNPHLELDEDLDEETLHFFIDFVKENENNPIKEKVEKILDIFQLHAANNTSSSSKDGLTNKVKNEILRNLKEEYLANLKKLNGIYKILIL
jgi:hypothetical protein